MLGEPTKGGLAHSGRPAGHRGPRVAEVPFDSDYKFMATFHEMMSDDGSPSCAATSRAPRTC